MKYRKATLKLTTKAVTSRAGVWIEIKALRRMPVCPYVTSRAGVWIEMVTTAIPLALDGGLR